MTTEEYQRRRNNIAVSGMPSDTVVELKNGRVIKIRHRPMPDYGWVATHEDITDQKRAEEALAEQSRRFEAALHNMPHGLSMFNGEERLIVCNRRYAQMYRLPDRLAAPGTTLAALTEFRVSSGQGCSVSPTGSGAPPRSTGAWAILVALIAARKRLRRRATA